MRRIRKITRSASTIWCIIGVSLLTVVAIELALRAVFAVKDTWIDGPVGNYEKSWSADYWREFSMLGTERRSYVEWRRKSFHGEQINIDSHGIRRTWTDPDTKSVDALPPYRIFVFGGSTLWGTGARDEATIPSFLAKILNAKGLQVEVVNLGETGYVTTQELVTLILCLQRGDIPDMTIFYDGINDPFSTLQNQVAGAPQNVAVHRVNFSLNLYLGRFSSDLKGFDRLAHGLNRRLGRNSNAAKEDDNSAPNADTQARDTVQVYERNLQLIRSLADSYGFQCHFFWQPVVFTKRRLTETEGRAARDMEMFRRLCLEVYHEVAVSETLAKNDRFHNISSIFDNSSKQCYLDFAHVTEEANNKIAKEIVKYLAPEIGRGIAQNLNHSLWDMDQVSSRATVVRVPEARPTEE